MPGQLVVSLDFELHWGLRDHTDVATGRDRLLGVRAAIPAILDRFRAHGIRATWATVGMLFAQDRHELESLLPRVRPAYAEPALDPYRALGEIGASEDDDPFHYAPSLVAAIAGTPGQELGTHTFSHFYGLERGATLDAFVADLLAARAVMALRGHVPTAIVFPRNQYTPDQVRVLPGLGIVAFRGASRGRIHRPSQTAEPRTKRAARLLDAYLPLTGSDVRRSTRWPDAPVVDVPSSRFLRPYDPRLRRLDPVRLERIRRGMTAAARSGGEYHLWWHPHNFGTELAENLAVLDRILEAYHALERQYGMTSAHMTDRARAVLGSVTPADADVAGRVDAR